MVTSSVPKYFKEKWVLLSKLISFKKIFIVLIVCINVYINIKCNDIIFEWWYENIAFCKNELSCERVDKELILSKLRVDKVLILSKLISFKKIFIVLIVCINVYINIKCNDIIFEWWYENIAFCKNELSCERVDKDVYLSTADCPVRFELVVSQFYCNTLAGLLPFTELVFAKLILFSYNFELLKAAIKKYIEIEPISYIYLYFFIYFHFILSWKNTYEFEVQLKTVSEAIK